MEMKQVVRDSPGRILQALGTCFCLMYLALGLTAVLVFVLITTGLVSTPAFLTTQQSFSVLGGALTANFIGFLTNILLVVSGVNLNIRLILPWLVFHLIFLLFLILGGLILLLHLLVSHHLLLRSLLCLVPILAGFLLIFVWLKVYLQLFAIRRMKRQKNLQQLRNLYGNQEHHQPYITHILPKDVEMEDTANYPLPGYDSNNHFYANKCLELEETNSRLVSVGTEAGGQYTPNYFFGDTLGILRRFNRSMETIEASITFEEEREIHDYENVRGSEESQVDDVVIISSLGIFLNNDSTICFE